MCALLAQTVVIDRVNPDKVQTMKLAMKNERSKN